MVSSNQGLCPHRPLISHPQKSCKETGQGYLQTSDNLNQGLCLRRPFTSHLQKSCEDTGQGYSQTLDNLNQGLCPHRHFTSHLSTKVCVLTDLSYLIPESPAKKQAKDTYKLRITSTRVWSPQTFHIPFPKVL